MQRPKVQRAFTGMVGLPPEPAETPVVSSLPELVPLTDAELSEIAAASKENKSPVLFQSMRSTLMLEPEDLIALFEETPTTRVGEKLVFQQADFLLPAEMLQHRIERLKKIIAASKAIIDGLSVRVMKIRRAEDDVLDKPTREKFKREETGRMARSNAKLSRYRAALRAGNYREKVWCYQTQPVYFRDVVDDCMTFTDKGEAYYIKGKPKTFEGTMYDTHDLVCDVTESGIYDVSRYEVVMRLDADALRLLEKKGAWTYWQRWENAVIKAAVFHGVLRPRKDLLNLLGLMPFVQAALAATESEVEADETENALALKTGGACYNGVIHGAGYRYNLKTGASRRRALEDFDKEAPKKDWDSVNPGGADSGFTSLKNITDDAESYDPR